MTPTMAPSSRTSRGRQELMVEAQLAGRGIADPVVLRAMVEVPREEFVPDDMAELASDDAAILIRPGVLLPQPYLTAVMLQAMQLDYRQQVLELGTGTGYLTALLALLTKQVVSVDPNPSAIRQVRKRLGHLGITNVTFKGARLSEESLPSAEFDAILMMDVVEDPIDDCLPYL